VLALFAIAMYRGQGETDARALTFATLIIANLGLIYTNRSWTRSIPAMLKVPNKALRWVSGGAIGFLLLVLYIPFLQNLFHINRLHFIDIIICLAAGILSILWFEVFKAAGMNSKRKGKAWYLI
jgi:Ca2+-transporting ATPase